MLRDKGEKGDNYDGEAVASSCLSLFSFLFALFCVLRFALCVLLSKGESKWSWCKRQTLPLLMIFCLCLNIGTFDSTSLTLVKFYIHSYMYQRQNIPDIWNSKFSPGERERQRQAATYTRGEEERKALALPLSLYNYYVQLKRSSGSIARVVIFGDAVDVVVVVNYTRSSESLGPVCDASA